MESKIKAFMDIVKLRKVIPDDQTSSRHSNGYRKVRKVRPEAEDAHDRQQGDHAVQQGPRMTT